MHPLPSLSVSDDAKPMQKSQPKGINKKTANPHEPIDVPVPKRDEINRMLKQAAKPKSSRSTA